MSKSALWPSSLRQFCYLRHTFFRSKVDMKVCDRHTFVHYEVCRERYGRHTFVHCEFCMKVWDGHTSFHYEICMEVCDRHTSVRYEDYMKVCDRHTSVHCELCKKAMYKVCIFWWDSSVLHEPWVMTLGHCSRGGKVDRVLSLDTTQHFGMQTARL